MNASSFNMCQVNDFSKDDLLQDEILKRELVRSLEIIGEATKKIPADCKIKMGFS